MGYAEKLVLTTSGIQTLIMLSFSIVVAVLMAQNNSHGAYWAVKVTPLNSFLVVAPMDPDVPTLLQIGGVDLTLDATASALSQPPTMGIFHTDFTAAVLLECKIPSFRLQCVRPPIPDPIDGKVPDTVQLVHTFFTPNSYIVIRSNIQLPEPDYVCGHYPSICPTHPWLRNTFCSHVYNTSLSSPVNITVNHTTGAVQTYCTSDETADYIIVENITCVNISSSDICIFATTSTTTAPNITTTTTTTAAATTTTVPPIVCPNPWPPCPIIDVSYTLAVNVNNGGHRLFDANCTLYAGTGWHNETYAPLQNMVIGITIPYGEPLRIDFYSPEITDDANNIFARIRSILPMPLSMQYSPLVFMSYDTSHLVYLRGSALSTALATNTSGAFQCANNRTNRLTFTPARLFAPMPNEISYTVNNPALGEFTAFFDIIDTALLESSPIVFTWGSLPLPAVIVVYLYIGRGCTSANQSALFPRFQSMPLPPITVTSYNQGTVGNSSILNYVLSTR